MKKFKKRILAALLSATMLLSLSGGALAANENTLLISPKPEVTAIDAPEQDLDDITEVQIDWTQSAQIPLDGWYSKTLEGGRQVKMYFPEYAACRAYFTIVAVPDGVADAQQWAAEQGYVDLMEARGEVLALLLPGEAGWGELEAELEYVTAAMNFVNSGKNDAGVMLFTNYSTFYLVGYEKGAAALEAWAAERPILVGSQAYIDAVGAGSAYLTEVGAKIYDGTNTGGYDPGIADLDEFEKVLGEHGYEAEAITRSEVAVPTWFVGKADADSVAYWKSANDCLETAVDGVYWQDKNSDAFQTEYANDCTDEDHGISQVKVTEGTADAAALAEFLYSYSRYNVPFAYSNHISERQDYATIRVEAQKTAQSGAYLTEAQKVEYDQPVLSDGGVLYDSYYVLAREQGEVGEGVVESGIVAFSDDNGDGVLDAREYLMYIPDSAKDDAPIVFQFPGMTQSVAVGFDSTQWWRVANDEGVIIVIVGEAYNNGVALSWKNSDMAYRAVRDILENDKVLGEKIDWTRVYGSGHSLGSQQVQNFVHTHPDFFAAVGSTSFGSGVSGGKGKAVPTMLVNGQSDLPFLMDDLWTSAQLNTWFSYLADVNGLKVSEASADNADAKVEGSARTWTYTWNNEQEIPMVKWGQTYLREHNCYPAEVPMAWDFVSAYSLAENGVRYYSASAFEKNDAVAIDVPADDLDDITELEIDWTQASQLPLTGYFTKTVSEGRTVKVYIAEEASIRSYFTVVAVPDGVDTDVFLAENGWFALADEKGEGLFVLEPGANGWGSAEEEAEYMAAAIGFLRSGSNANKVGVFSTFGEFYLAGYGKGADALELWAAANPILVISQVYVDGSGIAADVLSEIGKAGYDGIKAGGYADIPDFEGTLAKVGMEPITKAEVPVPSWFVNYKDSANIDYWKAASDVVAEAVDGVYYQSIDSDALQTEHANAEVLKLDADAKYGISQIKISDGAPDAAEIYDFLAIYSRYENAFAYANTLAYRVDYTAARVGAQKQAAQGKVIASYDSEDFKGNDVTVEVLGQADTKTETGTVQVGVFSFSDNNGDGKNDPREYLVYIPDSAKGKKAPVLMVYPGNTQTDGIFFDCTQWYQVADREGFVAVFVNETYSGPTAITHKDAQYYQTAMITVLENAIDGKLADLDFTRVYGTGQSLGCMTTQTMARAIPEFFAAVAATSGILDQGFGPDTGKMIPTYMLTGQSDLPFLLPDLWQCDTLVEWAEYFLNANGIGVGVDEYTSYELAKINGFDRVDLYTWENAQGIPMLQWGQTLMRAHNCYAGEMDLLWDYLEHFSMDENGVRYYSASAFEKNDAVVIDAPAISVEYIFDDVNADDWYCEAVQKAYDLGLMAGVSDSEFAPDASISRAMVAQILYSMEGKPAGAKSAGFSDVADSAWYAKAVNWAAEQGIVSGYGDGTFAPDTSVTREQLALMLLRYAESKKLDTKASADLASFKDAASVSDWAADAVKWAVGSGLIAGNTAGELMPAAGATRAQGAVILSNFAELAK